MVELLSLRSGDQTLLIQTLLLLEVNIAFDMISHHLRVLGHWKWTLSLKPPVDCV